MAFASVSARAQMERRFDPAKRNCVAFFKELGAAEAFPLDLHGTGNQSIRRWYTEQVNRERFENLNALWKKQNLSLRERAYRLWTIRHDSRIRARSFMNDPKGVERLRARDLEKYGMPDGPDFHWIVNKGRAQGLGDDAVYELVIESSSRTDSEVNARWLGTR